jgi:hypothetical protein
VLSVAALTGGPGYYLELANINYYLEGGEPLPLWGGTAARELGLAGVARRSTSSGSVPGSTTRPASRSSSGTPASRAGIRART